MKSDIRREYRWILKRKIKENNWNPPVIVKGAIKKIKKNEKDKNKSK
jgi:hypothetical protein